LVPQSGDVGVIDADGIWTLGEPVTRKGGNHDVEGWAVDTVGFRIREEGYQFDVFNKTARPTVGKDQRDTDPISGSFVDVVQSNAINLAPEVVKFVQQSLLL
jgi:hypothetical protein